MSFFTGNSTRFSRKHKDSWYFSRFFNTKSVIFEYKIRISHRSAAVATRHFQHLQTAFLIQNTSFFNTQFIIFNTQFIFLIQISSMLMYNSTLKCKIHHFTATSPKICPGCSSPCVKTTARNQPRNVRKRSKSAEKTVAKQQTVR